MVAVEVVGNAAATLALLGAVLFILRYAKTTWNRTNVGRHLMSFMAITAALLAAAVYISWFGMFAGWPFLRLFLYSLYAVVIWQRFVLLVRAQRKRTPYKGPERRRNE
jgi:Ca2+/Na+ antiporter